MSNTNSPKSTVYASDGPTHAPEALLSTLAQHLGPPTKKARKNQRLLSKQRTVLKQPIGLFGVDPLTRIRLRQPQIMRAHQIHIGKKHFHYPGDDRSEIIFQIALGLFRAGWSRERIEKEVLNSLFWQSREDDGKAEDVDHLLDKIFDDDNTDALRTEPTKSKSKQKKSRIESKARNLIRSPS